MNWFKRHKGWTTMFVLTLVAFVVGLLPGLNPLGIGRLLGYLWFGYLVLWGISGRKHGW